MSNANIVKILQDAGVDAQTLSEFMYKPADFMVERRLAPAVHTFDYYLNALDGARDNVLAELQSIKDDMRVEADNAIAQMFEAGGLPATPFATKALMEASELEEGSYAYVTDDSEESGLGLYVKQVSAEGGDWVKSKYNPPKIIDSSHVGRVKPNWIYSSITAAGAFYPYRGKERLLSDKIALTGRLRVHSTDPNIRIAIFTYNSDGSVGELFYREKTVDKFIDGYYRLLVSYEDDSDILISDMEKVVATGEALVLKESSVVPELEFGAVSYLRGVDVEPNPPGAMRSKDFISFQGEVDIIPTMPNTEVRVYLYDRNKEFLRSLSSSLYRDSFSNVTVDGFLRFTVRYVAGLEEEFTQENMAVQVKGRGYNELTITENSQDYFSFDSLPKTDTQLSTGDLWADRGRLAFKRYTPENITTPLYQNFPTHEEIYAFMDEMVNDYPEYVTRFDVGFSEKGLPIYGYKFTPELLNGYKPDYVTRHEHVEGFVPKIVFNSGVHGNEAHNIVGSMLFVNDICRNWIDIDGYDQLRWGMQIVFIPLVNPDGYNAKTYENGLGVNINRTLGTGSPTSEATALMQVLTEHNDAFAFIDHHRCFATSAKIWIGTNAKDRLGVIYKSLRDITIIARRTLGDSDSYGKPYAALTSSHPESASGWNYIENGVPSFLLETPNNVGLGSVNGAPTIIHSRDALAKLVLNLYDFEMRSIETESFLNQ